MPLLRPVRTDESAAAEFRRHNHSACIAVRMRACLNRKTAFALNRSGSHVSSGLPYQAPLLRTMYSGVLLSSKLRRLSRQTQRPIIKRLQGSDKNTKYLFDRQIRNIRLWCTAIPVRRDLNSLHQHILGETSKNPASCGDMKHLSSNDRPKGLWTIATEVQDTGSSRAWRCHELQSTWLRRLVVVSGCGCGCGCRIRCRCRDQMPLWPRSCQGCIPPAWGTKT